MNAGLQAIVKLAQRGLSQPQIQKFLVEAPRFAARSAKGAGAAVDDVIKQIGIKPANKGVTNLTKKQLEKLANHKNLKPQGSQPASRSGNTSSRPTKQTPTGQWLDGLRWGQVEDVAVRGTVQALENAGVDSDSAIGQAAQVLATGASAGLGVVQAARGRGSTGLSTNGGLTRGQAARRVARGETQSARGGQTPNPRRNNPDRVARQSQRRAELKAIKRDIHGNPLPVATPVGGRNGSGRAAFIAGNRAVKGAAADLGERIAVDPVVGAVKSEPGKMSIDQKVQNALTIKKGDSAAVKTAKGLGQSMVIMGEATGIPDGIRGMQNINAQADLARQHIQKKREAQQRKFGQSATLNGDKVLWAGTAFGWVEPDEFNMIKESVIEAGTPTSGGVYRTPNSPQGMEAFGQMIQQTGQEIWGGVSDNQNKGRSGAKKQQG
jgi:hypothetical protein